MTEIEKMYENAGAEPIDSKLEPMGTLKFSVDNIGNTWTREQYMKEVPIYPPFTSEKQLELIKLLGRIKDYIVEIDKFKDVYYVGCREAGSNNKHWGSHNIFEEALAEMVNDLWQSLADQEKEEIRNILK